MIKFAFSKLFYLNIFLFLLWLVAILGTYFSIETLSYVSVLGLFIPFFIIVHFLFFCFWTVLRKKQLFLSLSCLLLSVLLSGGFFKLNWFSSDKAPEGLKMMTYNTRGFNQYDELPISDADSLIMAFIISEQPDILCVQEAYYRLKSETVLDQYYSYKFVDFVYDGKKRERVIQAIFSKYPIKNVEIITFPNSSNSALCADITYKDTTIRLLNMHLQSFSIQPQLDITYDETSARLLKRMKRTLIKQEQQIGLINSIRDTTSYPTILAGDMNNTQFSKVYRLASHGFQDTFQEAGSGFGRTFKLFGIPLRIDYIFADENFQITSHTNYDIVLSDHYPVMATLKLKSEE